MKNIIYILLIFTLSLNAQNLTMSCEVNNTIEHDVIIKVDTLRFDVSKTLLIQDSAILYINVVKGTGRIKRGGRAGAPTVNGIDRFKGDINPKIILMGCPEDFTNLEIEANINIKYKCDNYGD